MEVVKVKTEDGKERYFVADYIEMINMGEIVKFYYEDEDGDNAVIILSYYENAFERLQKNISNGYNVKN